MTSEVRLVQEIEKHECLYNNNLAEYNRKDQTDEAWAHVSCATNLTITECKEKWRNIRSSLLRSLKPTEKAKKPYYLSSYLTFVLPFMKPLNGWDYKEDSYNSSVGSSKDNDILICAVKSEGDSPSIHGEALNETRYTDMQLDPLFQPASPLTRKRKRNSDGTSNRKKNTEEPADQIEQMYAFNQDPPRTNIESMHYFLMSLLPEFETMSEEQTRSFKIRVMMLIDDIKSSFGNVKQTMTSSLETERLNKRLINLLVRNLQKKT
ncbi:uncharacterized protein LOC120630511 [Pararge aegeria]|uniref:Jg8794 protein n=1 Tax=Pararge aegeria aegeria TaxID=348720 RepID=A0A8S4SDK2_9NEOP|nr:uncharacterized protein LOC120630511 [Pararge aegeria]CAH2264848.1 jg8794 [Pararge aegeria aegeria]